MRGSKLRDIHVSAGPLTPAVSFLLERALGQMRTGVRSTLEDGSTAVSPMSKGSSQKGIRIEKMELVSLPQPTRLDDSGAVNEHSGFGFEPHLQSLGIRGE
jgi:hypothetical protein